MCVCIFTVALKISNVSKKAKALKKQSERHVARSWWCSWWRWRWPLPPPLTSIIYICSCVQATEAIVRVRVRVRLKKVFFNFFCGLLRQRSSRATVITSVAHGYDSGYVLQRRTDCVDHSQLDCVDCLTAAVAVGNFYGCWLPRGANKFSTSTQTHVQLHKF